MLSALVGVTVNLLFGEIFWFACSLSVALAIVIMHVSKTLHPPGGATALIAVIGSPEIKSLGYLYVLFPVLTGAILLLIVALVFNNLTENRKYPTDGRFSRSIQWVLKPTKSKYYKIKNTVKWK